MAMWFGLLQVGAEVGLRNFVVFIKKREGIWRGYKTEDPIFDFGNWYLVPLTSLAQRALSAIELMEAINLIYALHHHCLKIFPKYRDRLAPHDHRKLLLK